MHISLNIIIVKCAHFFPTMLPRCTIRFQRNLMLRKRKHEIPDPVTGQSTHNRPPSVLRVSILSATNGFPFLKIPKCPCLFPFAFASVHGYSVNKQNPSSLPPHDLGFCPFLAKFQNPFLRGLFPTSNDLGFLLYRAPQTRIRWGGNVETLLLCSCAWIFFYVRADISFFEIGLEETFAVVCCACGYRKSKIGNSR